MGAQGCRLLAPSPSCCASICSGPAASTLELAREPPGDAEGWVGATCCRAVDTCEERRSSGVEFGRTHLCGERRSRGL